MSEISYDKIKYLIRERNQKLELVKPYISLKSYNYIAEKIQQEESALMGKLRKLETQHQKESQIQALPKLFFEQKLMAPKLIRID